MAFSPENSITKTEASLAEAVEQAAGHAAVRAAGDLSRMEVAAYLADLSGELVALARARGLDTVAYCLELARVEALLAEGRDY